jgi:hypothetical protein
MSKAFDKYEEQAVNGTLPADFDHWDLANGDGQTLAHLAAYYSRLPVDFSQWHLANSRRGWAVAHEATATGCLPDNFDQWGLTSRGMSVLHYLLTQIGADADLLIRFNTMWDTEKPLCKTEADWDVFKVELPEIYSKYVIGEIFDDCATQQVCLL